MSTHTAVNSDKSLSVYVTKKLPTPRSLGVDSVSEVNIVAQHPNPSQTVRDWKKTINLSSPMQHRRTGSVCVHHLNKRKSTLKRSMPYVFNTFLLSQCFLS